MSSPRIPLLALVLSVIAFLVSVCWLAPQLPERMATHFDAAGQANGWMPRSQHLVFIVSLGLGFPAVLCAALFSLRFLNPFRDLPPACEILFRWALWTGALHIIWTALLNGQIVEANRTQPPELVMGPILVLSGIYVAGAVVLIMVLASALGQDKRKGPASKNPDKQAV